MKWVSATINGKEVSIAFDENSIHIYNAFPIKDDLKMRGYRWNPADKSWLLRPGDVGSEMEVLTNNLKPASGGRSGGGVDIIPRGPVSPPSMTFRESSAADDEPMPMPFGDNEPAAPVRKKTTAENTSAMVTGLPDSLSVADLRNRIDRLIRDGIRGNIWVRGVVASDVKNYDWASYLDLKDEDEKRTMFFRMEVPKANLERINRKMKDSGAAAGLEKDLPIFCNVEVQLPLRNVVDVRLKLLDVLPEYTQAKIRNQREITLEKLKEEGILDRQKQLILPPYISRVGLITSEQGTSIKDIKAGLAPYGDKYDFYFTDSRMEGANAVESIIKALKRFREHAEIRPDVVIIARGGGSEQSLAVFNDLQLCRAVCLFPLPVITAIGHEKDVSAVEQCSWLTPTPSTPSGVGKYLQNRYRELQDQLSGTLTRLIHHVTTVQQKEMEKLKAYLKYIPHQAAGMLKACEERFRAGTRQLGQSMAFTVRHQEKKLAGMTEQLVKAGQKQEQTKRRVIITGVMNLLSRSRLVCEREDRQVRITMGKLDFGKRFRDNQRSAAEIRKKAENLLTLAIKTNENERKHLTAHRQLVNASDPQRILEKGFTLTLDEENRVITSINAFNKLEHATLRFHDGEVPVARRDTDEKNTPSRQSIDKKRKKNAEDQ